MYSQLGLLAFFVANVIGNTKQTGISRPQDFLERLKITKTGKTIPMSQQIGASLPPPQLPMAVPLIALAFET